MNYLGELPNITKPNETSGTSGNAKANARVREGEQVSNWSVAKPADNDSNATVE